MTEIKVGTLANFPPSALANRAVTHVMERKAPLALCLNPDGMVTLERFDDAVLEDVVGVYDSTPGLLALYRDMREDLVDAVQARGVTGKKARRYVRRAA